MEKKAKKRLLNILESIPPLKDIMLSTDPLEKKRHDIRELLNSMLINTYDDNPDLPSLTWMLSRDAILVFRNIISRRSEKVAGFSFLGYLNELIHKDRKSVNTPPSPDFLAELTHLLHGISGKADVYPKSPPAFAKFHGTRAAKLRSVDLSRMARNVEKFSKRYPSGLDDSAKRRRYNNKLRILRHFKVTDFEWSNWRWQMRHIIKDAKTLKKLIKLTDEQSEAVEQAQKHKVPLGITPYYLSLMDYEPGQGRDNAIRAQVIPTLKYIRKLKEFKAHDESSMDFMLERDTSPIEGITRRYPQIVILKPVLTCPQICVYCQRNWEIEDVYSRAAILPKPKLEKAIQWIAQTPEINEVLITGGDPFILSNDRIESLLYKLSRIDHIQRIRIGTRTLATLPQRITDTLVKDINHFHIPGKREILIVTHFEHPYEITHNAMEAVQRFRRYGIEVYNQLVYTFFNSRKFEATVLRNALRLIGVTPYYTFNTKGKEETDDYRVPIPRLLQEQKEEARLMPGTVRTDEIVFNVPRLGKNYLRAIQHHDVISIQPDGRRVYEFHPWEKKLALADTYVYTDVSIHGYLQRLKDFGENISDYKSIWYYY
ncbi:MAG: KamA family radical SAM protein [Candidatus Aminicenantes bacterium]|nr:MAG: KamA family radical SAM protein [Candidatus Aminicenantes bacterium]